MNINYPACLEYLYPDIQRHHYSLRDDGAGVYIEYWEYPQKQPTMDEVHAVKDAAHRQAALKQIRIDRNQKLVHCDWTQLPDSHVKNDWKIYRQALRDFPANCDPLNPVWPTPPEYSPHKAKTYKFSMFLQKFRRS